MTKLPLDSKSLIEALNAETPHRCPTQDMTDRDIWVYVGKRQLVDYLISLAEQSRVRIDKQQVIPTDDEGEDDVLFK